MAWVREGVPSASSLRFLRKFRFSMRGIRLLSGGGRGTQVEGGQGCQEVYILDAFDAVGAKVEPLQLLQGHQPSYVLDFVIGCLPTHIHRSSFSRTGKHSRFYGSSSSQLPFLNNRT